MTEGEARAILAQDHPTAITALDHLAELVTNENARQNLVSASSLAAIWTRHILDSTQLVRHAPAAGLWVDIGTGAGFPGLAVAIVRRAQTWLIEPRRRRAEFLSNAARALGLDHVVVHQSRAETIRGTAAVISARAVAPIEGLLAMSRGFATPATRFIFPRGRNARKEADELADRGVFHVEQSATDAEAGIVIGEQVAIG